MQFRARHRRAPRPRSGLRSPNAAAQRTRRRVRTPGDDQRAGDAAQRRHRPSAGGRGTPRTSVGHTRRIARRRARSSAWCSSSPPTASSPHRVAADRLPTCPREGGSAPFPARRVFGRRKAPLIARYSLPEMAGLFTDEARFGAWLEVEILATEAWAELGVVPAGRRGRGPRAGRFRRRRDRRARADHRARRRRVRRRGAGAGRQPGGRAGCTTASRRATSSTPRSSVQLVAGARPPDRRRRRARGARSPPRPTSYRDTPMVGRTHGIHAEPTTFGVKLALWALQVRRDRERLAPGPRARSRSASSRARSAPTPTSIPRSRRTCASARAHAGARHPGARPRPSRRAALRVRVGRRDRRVVRARDPPPPAHRGARGRGAVPRRDAEGLRARCRTSATR